MVRPSLPTACSLLIAPAGSHSTCAVVTRGQRWLLCELSQRLRRVSVVAPIAWSAALTRSLGFSFSFVSSSLAEAAAGAIAPLAAAEFAPIAQCTFGSASRPLARTAVWLWQANDGKLVVGWLALPAWCRGATSDSSRQHGALFGSLACLACCDCHRMALTLIAPRRS